MLVLAATNAAIWDLADASNERYGVFARQLNKHRIEMIERLSGHFGEREEKL